jgi:hypothetical protein
MEDIVDTALLATRAGNISLISLTLNIFFSAVICSILSAFYIKFGTSLTNRSHLAKSFVMIGVTTTLIITVVKASLALSLGLVGALSIVRFRAAIKEPEELAFLFLAIAVGLGFGADNGTITIVAFFLILILFYVHKKIFSVSDSTDNIYFSVKLPNNKDIKANKINSIVMSEVANAHIKRFDVGEELTELVYLINIKNYDQLESIKNQLNLISKDLTYSFVEEAKIF